MIEVLQVKNPCNGLASCMLMGRKLHNDRREQLVGTSGQKRSQMKAYII